MRGWTPASIERQARIVEFVTNSPAGVKMKAIADHLGISEGSTKDHVRAMRDAGLVVCVGGSQSARWTTPERAAQVQEQMRIYAIEHARELDAERRRRYRRNRKLVSPAFAWVVEEAKRAQREAEEDAAIDPPIVKRTVKAIDCEPIGRRIVASVFDLGAAA